MTKIPTFTAGTFYVSSADGRKMVGGRDFSTLEAAIEAAKSSIRRSLSNARAHGTASVDVVETIPGRHTIRATVTPSLTVEMRG